MAKKKTNAGTAHPSAFQKLKTFLQDKSTQAAFGFAIIFFAIALLASSLSFFFNWSSDFNLSQVSLNELLNNPDIKVRNVFGKLGFRLAHLFVYRWFGLSALILALFIGYTGMRFAFNWKLKNFLRWIKGSIFSVLWLMLFIAWLSGTHHSIYSGGIGFYLNRWLVGNIGTVGTGLLLFFSLAGFLVIRLKLTPDQLRVMLNNLFLKIKPERKQPIANHAKISEPVEIEPEPEKIEITFDEELTEEPVQILEIKTTAPPQPTKTAEEAVQIEVEETVAETAISESKQEKKLQEFGEYDPKLDLSKFKLPPLDLLNDYGQNNITIDQEELEANKNRIVDTLNNYKIDIAKITATIGPTVTLYEIVPAAGVRISKIKNLEDDIALSLSALGIRIIAPIPGRGTIGIEVPNKKPKMVAMRHALASEKFQNAKMELPIALGKTISNETFVADLAKMPHLLMAGATGQGKSVGLNAILASILYKKHPAQVKFVLVDPKKVELTLYNHIERHYLAKLPDSEDAIITDTSKVIHTLNSLCIEMDQRYDLLKSAQVRNLSEYNEKFIKRRLNPEEGHRYLPYIVLVIDEFADLIMTAGKEVETPIARLAQLARAIGIHLIIATQRPSVNVITGIIKANFPARIAFRVTSKIDSRTILDAGGADQLIGKGDMLFSSGNDLIRIQCAFLDTPEVERICDYIGAQQGYATAYELPEYVGEEGGSTLEGLDPADRDSMFAEAARVVVIHQQGSASLLQRKLKLGYNRAGRIIDQLEAAGIIGPFEGSKARQVLVQDENTLEQILNRNK